MEAQGAVQPGFPYSPACSHCCDPDSLSLTHGHAFLPQVVGSSPNLTFKVEPERAGRYYCRATVPGYPEIGAEAVVLMKGPPKVLSPHTQWGHVGDNARVECIVSSVPRPEKILWSFGGQEISTYDSDFSVRLTYCQWWMHSSCHAQCLLSQSLFGTFDLS